MRHGLPIVASKLGAFPERLAQYANSKLIEWNAAPENWNAALMDAAGDRNAARDAWTAPPAGEYRAKYLTALRAVKAADAPPRLAAHHYFASHALPAGAETPLAHLYTAAIECGYAPRREEFRQRVKAADGNLAAARQETVDAYSALSESERAYRRAISELQSAYADLEKVAKNANDAYQGVIDSTTWRMTGPLRNAVHRMKGWRQRLSVVRWHVSRLPQDVKRASQLAKEQGVSAVIQKIAERSRAPSDLFDAPLPQFAVESELLPLALDTSQTPKWSLLIPVHGQHDFTYTCLKSIAQTCAGLPIEVIVVDDCSETPASEALSMVSGVEFRRNETNLGFLKTCNAATAHVRGEFVVLLNNDTLVTGDWLKALTAVFDEDEKAGLVGAKLLFGNGRLQEAGGIVWRDGSASNYGRNEDPRRPEFNYRREADYCSAACVMIRRSLWNTLGGFDERYVPAYYEDTDLAFRVREAGYKVIYQPHAEVVHFEGKSSGTDLTQGVKRHQVINQATFEARWRHTLAAHRPRGQMIHFERDRAALRRVLVIDVCLVRPDRDSGSLRMYEMLKAMRQLGCRVSFVADNREYVEKYARLTQSLGVEVLHAPYLSTPGEAITRHGAEFDVVMLSRAPVAVSHVDAVKKLMPHAKLVFDTVDLHFLRQEREAEVANDDALRTEAARMKKIELDLIAKADATLVVSSAEKDLLETIAPRAKVHVVSNIHEPAPGAKPFSARSGLVFIGGFRFAPNVDAMVWFASEILPLLRAKGTGIRTTVIGSDVPDELRHFAADDFAIAGYVPDIAPLYDKARIAIAPLRFGAGVKGKVNTAMQYGVPVVATPCAVEGMHLIAGEDMLTADTPQAFADAIARLHSDEALWTKLRQGGLNNIERWFSRARARQVLRTVLDV
jgi:GT2 family glycosyltransferase